MTSLTMIGTDRAEGSVLRQVVANEAPLAVLVLVHWAVAAGYAAATGVGRDLSMTGPLQTLMLILFPIFLLLASVVYLVWLAVVVRPERPVQAYLAQVRALAGDPVRILGAIVAMTLIVLFMQSFSFLKNEVPVGETRIVWDPVFARIDAALHGGRDPWLWLTPILNVPVAVTAFNAAYHAWFFLLYFAFFHAALSKPSAARDGFLIGSVLTWAIGGNLLAILFASGGPVFYEGLGYGDRFAPLVDRLHAIGEVTPVWSLDVQKLIWEGHTGGAAEFGMSALPSMHVAASVLLALYATAVWRPLAWVFWPFAGAILIGSVLLGWHYAIDGYVGGAVAWGGWTVARRFRSSG